MPRRAVSRWQGLIRELFISDDLIGAIISLQPFADESACVLVCNRTNLTNSAASRSLTRPRVRGGRTEQTPPRGHREDRFRLHQQASFQVLRLVDSSEIVDKHKFNLNIRHYVDNTPEPERRAGPSDWRHPRGEIEARAIELPIWRGPGTSSCQRPGYLAFREQIDIKSAIKTKLKPIRSAAGDHLAPYGSRSLVGGRRDDFAGFETAKDAGRSHELLATFKEVAHSLAVSSKVPASSSTGGSRSATT
jgi:type I restriction enzyme M protein